MSNSMGLVCVDTLRYEKTINAIKNTLSCIKIDKIYWFSDIEIPESFDVPVVWNKINKFEKENFFYDNGILYTKTIPSIVDTDFTLYIHSDGFAVNKSAWNNKFLDYDYIGAPWPFHNKQERVGNGGFSLKSRKMHNALLQLNIHEDLYYDYPEDNIVCRLYRKKLINDFQINFAPEEIACQFSMECYYEYPYQAFNYWIGKSFGFHNINVCEHYGFTFSDLK